MESTDTDIIADSDTTSQNSYLSNFNIFTSEVINGEFISKVLDSNNMVEIAKMMKNINVLSDDAINDKCPCFLEFQNIDSSEPVI